MGRQPGAIRYDAGGALGQQQPYLTPEDVDIRLFLRGIPASAPLWLVILEAARFDPLRAQEIEAGLSEDWWTNYMVYRRNQGIVNREAEAKRGK